MKRHGFTLIELLIVVAIIAILAAIAVPNFLEAQTRSKVSRAKSDLRTLQLGLEMYFVDNNSYPYTESINASIWLPPQGPGPASAPADRAGGLTSPVAYLSSIPRDPFRHGQVNLAGVQVFDEAPIYYERAGFGYKNGVKSNTTISLVPSDAVGTGSMDGVSLTNTQVTNPAFTPRPYILYSLGPDLSPHVKAPGGGPNVTNSRWSIFNRYDPTNGTVSAGNVVRLDSGLNYP